MSTKIKLQATLLMLSLLSANGSLSMTIGSLDRKDAQLAAPVIVKDTQNSRSNHWIPIPAWLAGTWETKFQTFLDSYDCRSGKQLLSQPTNVSIFKHRTTGEQQDASGQIWHYASTPYERSIQTDLFTERQTIVQLDVLSLSPGQVKIRTVGKVERVFKNWERGTQTFYEVTMVTYSPIGDGLVKTDLTITDYDTDGKPALQSISVCVERRLRRFVAINSDERGNLRENFLRFLAERASNSQP